MSLMRDIQNGVAEAKTKPRAATGGTIMDQEVYAALMSGAAMREGGRPLRREIGMFLSRRVCRFPIAGAGLDMTICGEPATKKSYCNTCYAMAYYPATSRTAERSATSAAKAETKQVQYQPEPILDLCGEVVEG